MLYTEALAQQLALCSRRSPPSSAAHYIYDVA